MKHIIFAALLFLAAGTSYAQSAGSTATSGSSSGASAGATNAGNTQQIGFTTVAPDDVTVRQVAPIGLGGAAAGFANENCGNTVQGAAGTLIFSVAKGDIKESNPCNMRRDAGVFATLASTAKTDVEYTRLRAMAILAACKSDPAWLDACHSLHLIK